MDKKQFIFIANPISGMKKGASISELISEVFPAEECEVTVHLTEYRNHASELAKSYSDSNCTVVAIGGDGTINEVAKELLNSKTASLGIVPTGSGNGLARSLRIPLNSRKALQRIKDGKSTKVDTCTFNDIPFFCTAGVAFDAKVAEDFDELPTRGLRTYFQASYRQFKKFKGTQITAKINGQEVKGEFFMMAFANAEQYGYGAKINPAASLQDGLIEIAIIRKLNLLKFGEFTTRLFSGTVQGFSHCETLQSSDEITISTESTLAHLDGEPLHFNGEAVIKIHPESLRILL